MSIMRQMKDKAVAMAEAMAQRARTPQDIEAVRQRLVAEIQGGRMPAYVGIPLVQDLTQRLTKAKAEMAQQVAGMGVPQAPQGAPIAQQVMAQAQPPAGVEALSSNLPQSYAPGGLVAFEEGGQVERYQTGGSPASRWWESVKSDFSETNEAAKLRNQLQMKYGPASALPGLFMSQTDEQRQQAKQIAQLLPNLSLPQLKMLNEQGPAAIPSLMPPPAAPTVAPAAAAAPTAEKPPTPPAPPPAAPAADAGIGGLTIPSLQTFTPKPAVLPERTMEPLTDLNAIVSGMPEKTRKAAEDAVKETQAKLEAMDRPGFEAREGRLGKREATLEKGTAMDRALNTIFLGLKVAGSKERTLAGALGNEGAAGIQALIQGEAASRAARDRLEEYRDNLEQQKVAAKKGNYSAAQTAGREASRDLQAATQLSLAGAQAGNAQAISMYSALQQGDIGRATVANQGQQLQMSAVDSANRNALGIAQLQQQNAATSAQLQLGRDRLQILKDQINAGNVRAQAALAGAQQKAYAAFSTDPQTRALMADLQKKYGTLQNPSAQLELQQARQTYMMNALPALLGTEGAGGTSIKDVAELLKD